VEEDGGGWEAGMTGRGLNWTTCRAEGRFESRKQKALERKDGREVPKKPWSKLDDTPSVSTLAIKQEQLRA